MTSAVPSIESSAALAAWEAVALVAVDSVPLASWDSSGFFGWSALDLSLRLVLILLLMRVHGNAG